MPTLIHNSKSSSRPDLPVDTSNGTEGLSLGEMSAATPLVFSSFQVFLTLGEGLGHVERMHMANPPRYTSAMDLHLLKEGGVSYTKVPLASYVTHSPIQSRVQYMSKILHNCHQEHVHRR